MFNNDYCKFTSKSASIKNFENRLAFGEVTDKSLVFCVFLVYSVDCLCICLPYHSPPFASCNLLPLATYIFLYFSKNRHSPFQAGCHEVTKPGFRLILIYLMLYFCV